MHYEGDRFHPNAEDDDLEFEYLNGSAQQIGDNDFDNMSYSTVSTNRKRQRKNWEDTKAMDKGFRTISRMIGYKPTKINFYSTSMTPGLPIRDAVTGARQPEYRVGSLNEHLFFKVGYATCEFGNDDGVVAFYDNPEQYERHNHCTISMDIKKKWTEKCMEIRARNAAK
jgi:hypothetical protein